MTQRDAEATLQSTRRILDAARMLVARGGAAEVSVGDVAAAAGVSKALVHYHFHDKDSLLVALVERVGRDVVSRQETATATVSEKALDDHWSWLRDELATGDLHVLSSLAAYDSDDVRAAARRVAQLRRGATVKQIDVIFSRFEVSPRVPSALLADTLTCFIDGLASAAVLDADRDPRPAFDVLWLALLTLAE